MMLVNVEKLLHFDNARKCPACGHAAPHNRGDYEDTHLRCTHSQTIRRACGVHGHARYHKTCDDAGGPYGCYSFEQYCDCPEEYRVIAELTSRLTDKKE